MALGNAILTPEILERAHDILYPWPKGSEIDWIKGNEREDNPRAQIIAIVKPIWQKLSQSPIEVDLPSPGDPKYLEQCCGLIFIIDQTRGFLKGTDRRWTRAFFDPAAEKLALQLYHSKDSPYKKETWLERGWSFDHFIVRVNGLWAPMIHSERVMSQQWQLNDSLRLYLRKEVEEYTGERDPGRDTEEEDSKDPSLFAKLLTAPRGKTIGLADHAFWWLRVKLAHHPIIQKFGRYPHVNDMVGHDFEPGELEWVQENGKLSPGLRRLDDETREAIRKDVDAGVWTPLKFGLEEAREL